MQGVFEMNEPARADELANASESRGDVVEQVQKVHGHDHVERLRAERRVVERARPEVHVG